MSIETSSSPQRVLCYAPYHAWELHGQWELTIAHGLKHRGAEVEYLLCDGMFTDCDMHWQSTRPRQEHSCNGCQAAASAVMNGMQMPYRWLGRYQDPDDERRGIEWMLGLEREQLLDARYGEWQIGRWIEGSVHSSFATTDLDLTDEQVERTYRSYLYSGLLAAFALDRALTQIAPDVLFLFNGRLSSTRVAVELCQARGIRVVCHERGVTAGSLAFWADSSCLSPAPFEQMWDSWGEVPLSRSELRRTHRFLGERRHGKNFNWYSYSPKPQNPERLRASLGLSPERPLWVLFTSRDDENAAETERYHAFSSQLEWIERTVSFARQHPEIDLLIRVHPNTSGNTPGGENNRLLAQLAEIASRLPDNAAMIGADDPTSSYSLIDIATVGLSFFSTIGLEMACSGKPVVVGARAVYANKPFVTTVRDAESYDAQLAELLAVPPQQTSRGIQRLAYRFTHGLAFQLSQPFPLVRLRSVKQGELTYSSIEALRPGRDAALDHACRVVLEGAPPCPPPSAHREVASTDEDRFFDELEASGAGRPARRQRKQTSIIILNLNGGEHMQLCLNTLQVCTRQPHQLIVVDNGSTDGSKQWLREQKDVVLVENETNLGAPYGRNQGLAVADGDYVVFLDNDTMMTPNWLRTFIRYAEQDEEVGIWGPRSNHVSGPQLVPEVPYQSFEELSAFAKQWAKENRGQSSLAHRLILFCFFVRREVIDKIGGIDPDFGKWGWEDDDYSIRAQIAGYKLGIAHEVFIHHTGSKTAKSANLDYNDLFWGNWDFFRGKWGLDQWEGHPLHYPVVDILDRKFDPAAHSVAIPDRSSLTIASA